MTTLLSIVLALQSGPLTAEETRDFMKRLVAAVEANHLKKDPKSEQRGMTYEYFDVKRKGQPDQWVQGEALDTMHDGAWFGAALVNASRATGDPLYKDFLTKWTLPFYLRMLNHSDTLFTATQDDVAPKGNRFNKEHRLQQGEKGFVPYWWDDGASVSLERRRTKNLQPDFSATDRLTGKPNPTFALDGWSHGSSNHLAQDLGLFTQEAWLLLRESDPKLAAEVAEAAKNLYECRLRHHGPIPAVTASAAICTNDRALLKKVPEAGGALRNHYTAALAPADPAKPQSAPGFADDQEYVYSWGIARSGGELPRPLAFRLVYDAFTNPMLFRYHSDNADVAPGMGQFDLHPLNFIGGKPSPYRSVREVPTGSRFGPQNMIVCGWALQALKAAPGLWEERIPRDLRVRFDGTPSEPVTVGAATVRLSSTRTALRLAGTATGDVALRVYSQPDAKGSFAELTVKKDGCVATNDAGQTLVVEAKVEGSSFDVTIPYTVVKDQKPWANGIEHFRYTLASGDATRTFTLASTEAAVVDALTRELGEGLRTWRKVLDEKGYIPTGSGPGWSQFSDTGGYAHLLSAGAQWLIYIEGRRDWELHRIPRMD